MSEASYARALAALVCGVLLAACDDAPDAQAAATPKSPQAASKLAGLPAEMVAAVSAGRSATMISVHFALSAAPTIDKPLPVEIAVVPHVPFSSVRVSFEARDGVKLGEAETIGPLTDPKPEKAINHRIVLLPLREGVYMVTATVDTEGSEGSITRVFSIPVIVSPPVGVVEKPAGEAPATPAAPIPAGESASAPPPAA